MNSSIECYPKVDEPFQVVSLQHLGSDKDTQEKIKTSSNQPVQSTRFMLGSRSTMGQAVPAARTLVIVQRTLFSRFPMNIILSYYNTQREQQVAFFIKIKFALMFRIYFSFFNYLGIQSSYYNYSSKDNSGSSIFFIE
ncbi:hypothetical protein ACFSYG_01955 [Leeuwenhoekiella polynyae]|uniref:hypothetical protein n=1 Tax=Leeuwenhoekiella polynyae TaxID=1550906 RepID=UPI000FFECD3B|nr:hypothetical protein [Leeuwenhoekiella polynyae]